MESRNASTRTDSCQLARTLTRDLMDRLVLPGALGFTRFGYQIKKRSWSALPEFPEERVAVVTGATSGLGRIVAEQLASLGARVVLVGRNPKKLEIAIKEIAESTGSRALETEVADLSLRAEVRDLACRLLARREAIHILVNNAAVLPLERELTSEGLETATPRRWPRGSVAAFTPAWRGWSGTWIGDPTPGSSSPDAPAWCRSP